MVFCGLVTSPGTVTRVRQLVADLCGATMVETAIVLPVFLLLIFGVIEGGALMFAQLTLDNAVATAARCAAINTTLCGTQANIQSYTVSQAVGLPNLTTAMVNATACSGNTGNTVTTVSATYTFTSMVGNYVPYINSLTLKAAAQYPCA
jgi:Flp pilus assembly protein TadG